MKPSWDEQRRNESRTDRKFRPQDEHLLAENKEEVAKINHGDELESLVEQKKGSKAPRKGRK